MGYYTDYVVYMSEEAVKYAKETYEELDSFLDYAGDAFNSKWYDWLSDCKDISITFPDEVITVRGQGEGMGDLWLVKFKAGKVIHDACFDWDMLEESC